MIFTKPKRVRDMKTYRCPGCGETVDNLDREAVRLHHDHVLRPRQNPFAFMQFLAPHAGRSVR
jgi:hypothetical protein